MVVFYDSSDDEPTHTPSDNLSKVRAQLPMWQARKAALRELRASPVLILVGSTGSGKSTQLPQIIANANPRARIVITQPRRVAAISLARRVSEEVGTELGNAVGFAVRFHANYKPQTQIKYVTDGMLMREFAHDPELRKYTHVVIDEAHERTVTTDLLLGLLKQLRHRRNDLRIVVMSATLDAQRFADFFGKEAQIVGVPGRAFPVEQLYLREPIADVVAAAVETVQRVNRSEPLPGDILVFLPGQEEIVAATEMLNEAPHIKGEPKIQGVPLYASLPEHLQQLAFATPPKHTRKVVFATNIAETSLTIPGTRFVIDSGLRKVRIYRPKLGLDSLLPAPVSQASANQRAGRAGREAAGKCWRLYTLDAYNQMAEHTEPEIKRVSVSSVVLALKVANTKDVSSFPWLDKPADGALEAALLQLYALKALNDSGQLTKLGRAMAALPVDPPMAAVLVNARQNLGPALCDSVIDVVSCLCVPELLQTPSPSNRNEVNAARGEMFPAASQHGDLYMLKSVIDMASAMPKQERRIWCKKLAVSMRALTQTEQVRQQLRRYLNLPREPDTSDDERAAILPEDITKAFLAGYAGSTAVGLPDRRYQTIAGSQTLSIHPSSTLFGRRVPAIMYLEYVFTTRGYARTVVPIELEWLREAAPHLMAQ